MTTSSGKFVGIDVAKEKLDIAVLGETKASQVSNDEKGIANLIKKMKALKPELIVVEATGGYQRAVVLGLYEAGLPVAVVNPARVRQLRALISYRWRLVKMSTAIQNRMHSLLRRHNIQAPQGKIDTGENREWWEKLELSELETLHLKQEIKTLRLVRENIVEVERELGRLSTSEGWGDQAVYLMQLPGVGRVTAATLLQSWGNWTARRSRHWWAWRR